MEIVLIVVALLAVIIIAKGVCIIPQQSATVIERLGKFDRVLHAGISYIIPFVDRVAYKHTLKEQAMDIPEQVCITRDNVQVGVDGVIFIQVFDPQMASYGISNYVFSIVQLAQTTMRSEVGKIDLDKTFEERTTINSAIVNAINDASRTWGVKILRYEIKNIRPWKNRCRPNGRSGRSFCNRKAKSSRRSMWPRDRSKKWCWNRKRCARNKSMRQPARRKPSAR